MKAIVAVLLLASVAVYAENQCPSEQETDWSIELLLRHEDCNKFYKCTYGKPVEQSCTEGLYFNLETWQCDWQDNVSCEGRHIPDEDNDEEVAPELEASPEEEAEQAPEPEQVEPEEDPQPEPEPEPEVEEEESLEEAVEEEAEQAPESEQTEPEEDPQPAPEPEPEVEEEEAEEEAEEEVEEKEEATEQEDDDAAESEIEFLENGCPVSPHVHWLLPDEEDCNQFYYCVWGEKVLRQCASTLHFNRYLQVCDWPADAGCNVSANKHYSSRMAYRSMV